MIEETPDREFVYVDVTDLRLLDVRPSLVRYVKTLSQRRHYVWADARAKAFQAGRDTFLGKLWLVGEPLMTALLYGSVFGLLLKTSRGIDNFIGFLLIGVMFFAVMNKQLQAGGALLRSSKSMITSFRFPIASVVLSSSLKLFLDALPGVSIGILVALALQPHKPISWTLLLVPVLLFLMQNFGMGLMFIVARVCAFIPDAKIIVGYLSSGWFFASGIFYSLERYADDPSLYNLLSKNPGYFYVQAVRDSVMNGVAPTVGEWALYVSVSFGTLVLGLVYFWNAEDRYRNAL